MINKIYQSQKFRLQSVNGVMRIIAKRNMTLHSSSQPIKINTGIRVEKSFRNQFIFKPFIPVSDKTKTISSYFKKSDDVISFQTNLKQQIVLKQGSAIGQIIFLKSLSPFEDAQITDQSQGSFALYDTQMQKYVCLVDGEFKLGNKSDDNIVYSHDGNLFVSGNQLFAIFDGFSNWKINIQSGTQMYATQNEQMAQIKVRIMKYIYTFSLDKGFQRSSGQNFAKIQFPFKTQDPNKKKISARIRLGGVYISQKKYLKFDPQKNGQVFLIYLPKVNFWMLDCQYKIWMDSKFNPFVGKMTLTNRFQIQLQQVQYFMENKFKAIFFERISMRYLFFDKSGFLRTQTQKPEFKYIISNDENYSFDNMVQQLPFGFSAFRNQGILMGNQSMAKLPQQNPSMFSFPQTNIMVISVNIGQFPQGNIRSIIRIQPVTSVGYLIAYKYQPLGKKIWIRYIQVTGNRVDLYRFTEKKSYYFASSNSDLYSQVQTFPEIDNVIYPRPPLQSWGPFLLSCQNQTNNVLSYLDFKPCYAPAYSKWYLSAKNSRLYHLGLQRTLFEKNVFCELSLDGKRISIRSQQMEYFNGQTLTFQEAAYFFYTQQIKAISGNQMPYRIILTDYCLLPYTQGTNPNRRMIQKLVPKNPSQFAILHQIGEKTLFGKNMFVYSPLNFTVRRQLSYPTQFMLQIPNPQSYSLGYFAAQQQNQIQNNVYQCLVDYNNVFALGITENIIGFPQDYVSKQNLLPQIVEVQAEVKLGKIIKSGSNKLQAKRITQNIYRFSFPVGLKTFPQLNYNSSNGSISTEEGVTPGNFILTEYDKINKTAIFFFQCADVFAGVKFAEQRLGNNLIFSNDAAQKLLIT